jgi:hypothetical protein
VVRAREKSVLLNLKLGSRGGKKSNAGVARVDWRFRLRSRWIERDREPL